MSFPQSGPNSVGFSTSFSTRRQVTVWVFISVRISVHVQECCSRWWCPLCSFWYWACVIRHHECSGVLTSSAQRSSHHIGEYLCMNKNAEYLTEGDRQIDCNGRLFYHVCGSLPCPPYKSSQLISCVVCSE